jgi:hypothetical protein
VTNVKSSVLINSVNIEKYQKTPVFAIPNKNPELDGGDRKIRKLTPM